MALIKRCPLCQQQYLRSPEARRMSRDHIMPQSEGYYDFLPCGAINIRTMCVECNSMRGTAAHCIAIVACARAVAGDKMMHPVTVLSSWLKIRGP